MWLKSTNMHIANSIELKLKWKLRECIVEIQNKDGFVVFVAGYFAGFIFGISLQVI